jgi:hypothetical protein
MNLREGKFAVKTARKAIAHWVKERKRLAVDKYPESFEEKRGCFVTTHKHPTGELRGCIGIVYPAYPLIEALIEAAVSVCSDPRFPPLEREELPNITVEVSILTKPERLDAKERKDYPKKVKVEKHGLLIKKSFFSGLLLPQVATELKLTPEQFLNETCIKASLPPSCWLEKGTEVYRFSAQVFTEVQPIGKIVERVV